MIEPHGPAPRILTPRRPSATMDFELFDGYAVQDYTCCYSEFNDGTLAEVFLAPIGGPNGKVGLPLDMMAKDLSVLFSIARRYGAPVDVILGALSQEKNGAMLGPLGEFLRLHAREMPILPPAPPPDPSGLDLSGSPAAGALPPRDGASGEGDDVWVAPHVVVVLSTRDAAGGEAASKRAVPA